MKTKLGILAVLAFLSGHANAAGFVCTSESGYKVKLFNEVEATRTPAVLVIGHADSDPSTLLKAFGKQITKRIRKTTTEYSVRGNKQLGADRAIFQVNFREGIDVLPHGRKVKGALILLEGSEKGVYRLDCRRHLTNG